MKKLILIISIGLFLTSFSSEEKRVEFIYDFYKSNDVNIRYSETKWNGFSSIEKINAFYQTYYVTTSGNSSNNGLTEGNAWSLTHGLTTAATNDKLNVKAGDYGALQQTVSTNNLIIEGYVSTPSDIVAVNGTTFPDQSTPNTALGPTITGTTTTNRPDQDNGLIFSGSNVTIKNFQSFSYNKPLQMTGDNAVIDNWASYKAGNHNPSDLGGFSTLFPTGSYTGFGIIIVSDNHTLTNSFVRDAGAEGIKVSTSVGGTHNYNKVRTVLGKGPINNSAGSDGNSTDYHYLIAQNSSNIIIDNAHVEQDTGMNSAGHGIVVKSNNSANPISNITVNDFLVINTKIETQFPNVTGITFERGEVRSTEVDARVEFIDANIANGGSGITIKDVKFTGGASLKIRGWVDIYNVTYPYSIDGGKVLNCSFKGNKSNVSVGVQAIWITHGPGNNDTHSAKDVVFDHITIDDYDRMFYMSSDFEGIEFYNTIVTNTPTLEVIGYHDGAGPNGGTGGPYPITATWNTTNLFNSFSSLTGTSSNQTSLDPQLDVDLITTNATLLIAGVATSDYASGLPVGYMGTTVTPPTQSTTKSAFGFFN